MIDAAPASDGVEAVPARKRLAAAILARDEARRQESRVARQQRAGRVAGSLCQPETSISTRVTTAFEIARIRVL
jgi:hypothetical protein